MGALPRALLLGICAVLLATVFAAAADGESSMVVVGLAKCADCTRKNMKAEAAFKGLKVAVKCKSSTGEYETKATGDVESSGEFSVPLVGEDGELGKDCFAQLHSTSTNQPCPGQEPSWIVNNAAEKKTFVAVAGKMHYPSAECASAFLCDPFHKKHLFHKKLPVVVIPHPDFHHHKKPMPMPAPEYKPTPTPEYKPTPHPTPIYHPPAEEVKHFFHKKKPIVIPHPDFHHHKKPMPMPAPEYKPTPTPEYKPEPHPTPIYHPPAEEDKHFFHKKPIVIPHPDFHHHKKPMPMPAPEYKPTPTPEYKPAPHPTPIYHPPAEEDKHFFHKKKPIVIPHPDFHHHKKPVPVPEYKPMPTPTPVYTHPAPSTPIYHPPADEQKVQDPATDAQLFKKLLPFLKKKKPFLFPKMPKFLPTKP